MPKTHHKDAGNRLPTLFLDMEGNGLLEEAGEAIGKTVIAAEPSQVFTLFEDGLKKDTIYYAQCDKETVYDKVDQLQNINCYFRLGINLPSGEADLLDELIHKEVSIILAADRERKKWLDHFQRSQSFLVYIDPMFQPHLIQRYRSLHKQEVLEPAKELELDMEKARNTLSDAEVRILEKILEGKSNRKIEEECFLAVATVNNHVSHLTKKMKANDRTHTIKRAIEEGWVKIS
ncbi:response regulator transcription factor [Alteribacillus bidgolensis]|uniref:Regulatory protein, luxR family n=1 Tax=Alteribacillus bidgolensis TaxID=930129 RepID=A0A1G8E329_9BACI|nr:LuxR C-terminal-related transcriptional regulator [Alteribacillus bidgolensis]SDH64308.1 regulatory protein, luxR family [Alteribacillus bidgolensis]